MLNIDYKRSLIIEGSKSDKFKKLPKEASNLTVAEFYYLSDYLMKAMKKTNLKTK